MTVTGFSHVNVNCTDISKSLPFYADVLGVRITKQFPERSNTGRLVGLEPPHTNMVATLAPGRAQPGIELIEWRLPDTPHTEMAALDNDTAGIAALVFSSPEPDAVRDRAAAAGWPWRENAAGTLEIDGPEGRVHVVKGPDAALVGAIVNVIDLDAAVACYQKSLGLSILGRTDGVQTADVMVPTPGDPFVITLRRPDSGAVPPVVQRRADTPGLLRLAFFDDDVDGAYARAMEYGVRSITPGDYFDFGSLRAHAALWFDPDCVLIEVLKFETIKPTNA